ncbi:hypothetical protein DFH09DRAFT_1310858 [Mycena vulgaris]|nr:hypothetical protein DFH09DRAFT_1310858 [Mycena vulgaris]
MLDFIDAIWGESYYLAGFTEGDIQLLLPAVLGAFNLCFSIFGATATFKSRSQKEYDMLLACVLATGCVNMLAAYLRQNAEDTWFGWGFTMTLILDSVLNLSTAFRIMRAYREEMDTDTLPRYMPLPQEDSKDYVWIEEKWIDEKTA